MIISYNWLSEYLPVKVDAEKLSKILTSIGLEVESMHLYESLKGGLKGLITGEVLTCEKHPDADKLKITTVNTGGAQPLQIVCGAANVAVGQKVIVATVGTTIYPATGDPVTIKKAKIRSVESEGMICAEDEIGVGTSHEGIMVLPADTAIGIPAASLYDAYEDSIFEIGLTPNRMDAMSHLGVAKDVCAYLSHHDKMDARVKLPFKNNFKPDTPTAPIEVTILNTSGCKRYAGISINNITVTDSPKWLQQKLNAIGVKSINNIVDITNFILHETGQPLHAFDADKITGKKIIVKNEKEGTLFKTLDDKERKLSANDLVICNEEEPMCIAGVYGGVHSGVTNNSKNIFLESAWFDPQTIRKTSLAQGLRTDAATRFEKGVDISNTVNVLKRAALLIKEIAGGEIAGELIDVYPNPVEQKAVALKYHYLKKLSGKNYHGDTVKNILTALGFEIIKEGMDEIWVNVPFSKPDITLQADIVEEIMRIDGLDNIEIPTAITLSPSADNGNNNMALKEKMANYLASIGFYEIFTNSITNSKYYNEETLQHSVKMINSLSADLDIMRPSMLQAGLEVTAYNINRKNNNLQLFEFGKTYHSQAIGQYKEQQHLSIFITGVVKEGGWQSKSIPADFFYLKAVCENIIKLTGKSNLSFETIDHPEFEYATTIKYNNHSIAIAGKIHQKTLSSFNIKEEVFYADIDWDQVVGKGSNTSIKYKEVAKFPTVQRDLALIVDKNITYNQVQTVVASAKINYLKGIKLFDVFESDKLGAGKKSMAINFNFSDDTKTLTDKEIDDVMNKLIKSFEKNIQAEIRK
ncbi:MAG: phenylalanine--tRNA ligase subunit beta [Bacteroidetes bacterium]|nr:phenylalanine--tRNA ligase subunit beta [Bacteroidota bacterium]MBS1758436.1 phenylalanine--tRNA ligase subunit beta [Bacteroidota bacterium]